MNKKLLLLPLSLFTFSLFASQITPATIDLFKAINDVNEERAVRAIKEGADVNAIDVTNGRTPLMHAMMRYLELNISYYDRHVAATVLQAESCVLGSVALAAAYAFANAQQRKMFIGAGCLAGILAYKHSRSFFEYLVGTATLQQKMSHCDAIITLLCSHPEIDFSIRHYPTNKHIGMILKEMTLERHNWMNGAALYVLDKEYPMNAFALKAIPEYAEKLIQKLALQDSIISCTPQDLQEINAHYQHFDEERRSKIKKRATIVGAVVLGTAALCASVWAYFKYKGLLRFKYRQWKQRRVNTRRPPQPPPSSPPILSDLPNECPICSERVVARITHCNHQFCMQCLDSWLADHNTCPNCRQNPNPVRDAPART